MNRAVILRWLLAATLGLGGAWLVRRAVLHLHAGATTRVLLLDFARFQGCLFATDPPSEAAAPDLVRRLALGTGDPNWPETCASPLTRLEHSSDDIAADDAAFRPLADAVRLMENDLGEAVFWTEHVRHGSVPTTAWLAGYFTLAREVQRYARSRGAAMTQPEVPHLPRIARDVDAATPPPLPTPLLGGHGADVLSVTATPTEFAALLRDDRSEYTLCRVPMEPAGTLVHCATFVLPTIADARDAAFVPSDRGAFLAVWGRAPYSLRGLVDVASRAVPIIAGGSPDARRDFWAGRENLMALQIDTNGPAILVSAGGHPREVPLGASLDVLGVARALLGTPTGAAEIWLDQRTRGHTDLNTLALGVAADPPGSARMLDRFDAARMSNDVRIVPCSVPAGPSFALVGDAHGGRLYRFDSPTTIARGADVVATIDDAMDLACDASGVDLIRTREHTTVVRCDASACGPAMDLAVTGNASSARSDGALLVADAGGSDATPRVRRMADGVVTDARFDGAVPGARRVRLAGLGRNVALFTVGEDSYAWISHDGGRTFVSAVQ